MNEKCPQSSTTDGSHSYGFTGYCLCGARAAWVGTQVEAHPQEEQPIDHTGQGRLILNSYGRQCWYAGHAAAEAELQTLRARITELEQEKEQLRKASCETVPCPVCRWPNPSEMMNMNLICECCGFEPMYDTAVTDGVDGYRARWSGQWWDTEAPPAIIERLTARLTQVIASQEKLRGYVQHAEDCNKWVLDPEGMPLIDDRRTCTCGLSSLLTKTPK